MPFDTGGYLPGFAPEPAPITDSETIAALFAEFYAGYPRKEAKKTAFAAFARIMKTGEANFAEIIAGRDRYARLCRSEHRLPRYIALPATWLNGARWNDEIGDQPTASAATAAFLSAAHALRHDAHRQR